MTWPAFVFWGLIALGIIAPGPLLLLYFFFSFGAFTALNLIPSETSTVVPQTACAAFLVLKILLSPGRISRAIDAAIDPAALGFLFGFLVYGLFSSFVMPRLFAHMVDVVPMSNNVPWPVPLVPTGGNFNQSSLTTLSVGVVLAFSLAGRNAAFRQHALRSLLVGGLVLIATGLADLLVPASVLEPFRNAYLVSVDNEVLGHRRLAGLMPEASGFGPYCLVLAMNLFFLRPCFADRILRNIFAPAAAMVLFLMAALSTSSTAYLGLAAFSLVLAANWLRRALSSKALGRETLTLEAGAIVIGLIAIIAVLTFVPHAADPFYTMIDAMIFKKSQSASYIERSMWTRTALHAFFTTGGLGVGLGSARSSNWFAAVLGNTGIVGAAFLSCFFLRLFLFRCWSEDQKTVEFVTGLRLSLVPLALMMAASWTLADFGAGTGALLGLIASLTAPTRSLAAFAQSHEIRAQFQEEPRIQSADG